MRKIANRVAICHYYNNIYNTYKSYQIIYTTCSIVQQLKIVLQGNIDRRKGNKNILCTCMLTHVCTYVYLHIYTYVDKVAIWPL